MLTERTAQVEALRDARKELFIANSLQTIELKFPLHFQQMGIDKMRALIVRGIERGEQFEIRNRPILQTFIELTVAFGESFAYSQSSTWANEMISDPSLPAALKVRMVEERLFAETKGRPMIVE